MDFERAINDEWVITPNWSLTRSLIQSYGWSQQEKDRTSWQTPKILPIDVWLLECWKEYQLQTNRAYPILLSDVQELTVWERCLDRMAVEGVSSPVFMQPVAAARQVRDAYHQLVSCDADKAFQALPLLALNDDARVLKLWAGHFQERCESKNWIDSGLAIRETFELLKAGLVSLPDKLVFHGFLLPDPRVEKLSRIAENKGCICAHKCAGTKSTIPLRFEFETSEDELETVARWAKELVKDDEKVSVGIVLTDLYRQPHRIERLFDDVFGENGYEFNYSLTLSRTPIVRDALGLLKLLSSLQPIALWEQHLRSPFFNLPADDAYLYQEVINALRSLGEPKIALSHFIRALISSHPNSELCQRFVTLRDHFLRIPSRQTPGDWSQSFSTLLRITGWPRYAHYTERERNALVRFESILTDLAGLTMVCKSMTYGEALSRLNQIAKATLIRNRLEKNSRVRLLALDDAFGHNFSHLWVTGLSDRNFPRPSSPNAFIPISIARDFSLSRGTTDWELRYAETALSYWIRCADILCVSSARSTIHGDCYTSALIHVYPPTPVLNIKLSGEERTNQQLRVSAPGLEIFEDFKNPLSIDESGQGGSAILRDQATCPFKAFARHRLKARPLGKLDFGLNVRHRGILVHEALDSIWKTLKSQDALLHTHQLNEIILSACESAISMVGRQKVVALKGTFKDLELSRLRTLMAQWLELEKSRPSFTVIGTEVEHETTLGQLVLRVRVDRIDQIENGGSLIIDYKTGRSSRSSWSGERPDDPQLLIYSVTLQKTIQDLDAIAFGIVRSDKTAFEGIGIETGILGISSSTSTLTRTDWEKKRSEWLAVLTTLADAYVAGDAKVDPKNSTVCTRCDLHPICRISELQQH